MLKLIIPEQELYDRKTCEFRNIKTTTLSLEHSLVSVAKWEAKYQKPFLSAKNTMTGSEFRYYVKCMTLTQNVDLAVYNGLGPNEFRQIQEYMDNPMSATRVKRTRGGQSREIVTSEIIYYWMVEYGIPAEFQKWHLNRLLTLIQVCNAKKLPGKKMRSDEVLRQNAELNAIRRAALGTSG